MTYCVHQDGPVQTATEGTSNPEATETEGVQQTEQTDSVMAEAPAPVQVLDSLPDTALLWSHVIYKIRYRGLFICD